MGAMDASDSPSLTTPFAASAMSGHLDTRTAATEVAEILHERLSGPCHLVMVFGSYHHRAAFGDASALIRDAFDGPTTVGCTAESVLDLEDEREGVAGLSALALHLPGVAVHPWSLAGSPKAPDAASVRKTLSIGQGLAGAVMLADPFSTPIQNLLPVLADCRDGGGPVPLAGGMASGANQPGVNVLALDGEVQHHGAVGVSLSGDLRMDFVVSQGCRPIGEPLIITAARENVITELGGRKPQAILQDLAQRLSDRERALLGKGLFIGLVIDEYKDRFGRGDFLIRNILALDRNNGSLAIGDIPRVGQTVQFHVRDADTATEDLQLLLDAEQLKDPPLAGLLFTCNGRGMNLFDEPNHDVLAIRNRLGDLPLAGFFAAGEIGPIGERSFVHGHTASLVLLRRASPAEP